MPGSLKVATGTKPKFRTLDVEDVFYNHREVVATLRSGQTINLLDDDGYIIALITPLPEVIPKKSPHKSGKTRLRTT